MEEQRHKIYPRKNFGRFFLTFGGRKLTSVTVICKKLSKNAPEKISNTITRFKDDLRSQFYEKLENSDGRIRIEIILNCGKSFAEKIWFDFKKIRYTKNRLFKM